MNHEYCTLITPLYIFVSCVIQLVYQLRGSKKKVLLYIFLAGRIVTSFRASVWQEKVEGGMALEILRAHVVLPNSAGKLKRTAVITLAAETLKVSNLRKSI